MNKLFLLLGILLIPAMVDAIQYNITDGNDDYTVAFQDGSGYTYIYTSTTIVATDNEVVFPNSESVSYANVDTSGIPSGDVITSATLYWYVNAYTGTKRLSKDFYIVMLDADESGGTTILSDVYAPPTGWKSHALTAGELAEIDVGAGQKTRFAFHVPEVADFQVRFFSQRAYEYTGDYSVYLEVEHYTPSAGVCTNEYAGGDFIVNEEVNCTDEVVIVDGRTIVNESLLRLTNTNFTSNLTKQNILIGSAFVRQLGGWFR